MIKKIKVETSSDLHNGTSFHGKTIVASRKRLSELFGEPKKNVEPGKVTYLWNFVYETDDKETFGVCLYDWKFSRVVTETAKVSWNIGAKKGNQAKMFLDYLKEKHNLDVIDSENLE